jgi:hypothetical protein
VTGGKVSAAVLRVGDRVRFDGVIQTVMGLSGTMVRLADEHGQTSVIRLPHLLADSSFERLGQCQPGPLLPPGLLNGLPTQTVEAAQWWERHIMEVLTGRPADAPPDARPLPEFDPETRSLRQREQAKAEELTSFGHQGVGARTVNRKRLRYQAQGLAGLVDWRDAPQRPVRGRADPRVLEALGQAIEEATEKSTRTAGYFYWRVAQLLTAQHGQGGADAVSGDVLPAVRPVEPGPTHHRLGPHQTVVGEPARWAVRRADRRPAGRAGTDRLYPAGRAGAAGQGRARAGRADWDGGPGDPLDPGSGVAADNQVGGRLAAASPHLHPGADAAELGRGAADVALGASLSPVAYAGPAAGARRCATRDRAGDDRLRPRQGLHLQ